MSSCWQGCFVAFLRKGNIARLDEVGSRRKAGGYLVGDRVEIFSNSAQAWCSGVVEQANATTVTVTFQTPGDASGEYGRKEISIGHPDLRHAQAVLWWSKDEEALYSKLWGAAGTPDDHPSFFIGAGLPRKALSEIWQVANPSLKDNLDVDEFWLCCRLIGHCQAMLSVPEMAHLLHEGGDALHKVLEEECVYESPEKLAHFSHFSADSRSDFLARDKKAARAPVFSQDEEAIYPRILADAGTPQNYPAFFERSGLPRQTLKEIWEVANPEAKPWLGTTEFWLCCRLVGHCQSIRDSPGVLQLLEIGGPELNRVIIQCLNAPPKQLPRFHPVRSSAHTHLTTSRQGLPQSFASYAPAPASQPSSPQSIGVGALPLALSFPQPLGLVHSLPSYPISPHSNGSPTTTVLVSGLPSYPKSPHSNGSPAPTVPFHPNGANVAQRLPGSAGRPEHRRLVAVV